MVQAETNLALNKPAYLYAPRVDPTYPGSAGLAVGKHTENISGGKWDHGTGSCGAFSWNFSHEQEWNPQKAQDIADQSKSVTTCEVFLVSDGNYDTAFPGGSCMHTDINHPGNWWAVDLQQKYTIVSVKITNRGDCCGVWIFLAKPVVPSFCTCTFFLVTLVEIPTWLESSKKDFYLLFQDSNCQISTSEQGTVLIHLHWLPLIPQPSSCVTTSWQHLLMGQPQCMTVAQVFMADTCQSTSPSQRQKGFTCVRWRSMVRTLFVLYSK